MVRHVTVDGNFGDGEIASGTDFYPESFDFGVSSFANSSFRIFETEVNEKSTAVSSIFMNMEEARKELL